MSHWSFEEIESFSTDEIVSKLRAFGVPFETAQFLEDVKKFYSGEELADHWWKEHPITATGFDRRFLVDGFHHPMEKTRSRGSQFGEAGRYDAARLQVAGRRRTRART